MSKLWRVLFFPKQVFAELRDNTSATLPLALLVVCGSICIASIAFLDGTLTDLGTIDAQQIQSDLGATTNGPARVTDAIVGSALYVLGIVLGLLTLATYYWIGGKSFLVDIAWRRWFAFTCWSTVPIIYWSIATTAIVFLCGVDFKHGLSPLTWLGVDQPWAALLNAAFVWIVVISVQGIRSWGSHRVGTSTIIVLVPYVLYILIGSYYISTMATSS